MCPRPGRARLPKHGPGVTWVGRSPGVRSVARDVSKGHENARKGVVREGSRTSRVASWCGQTVSGGGRCSLDVRDESHARSFCQPRGYESGTAPAPSLPRPLKGPRRCHFLELLRPHGVRSLQPEAPGASWGPGPVGRLALWALWPLSPRASATPGPVSSPDLPIGLLLHS